MGRLARLGPAVVVGVGFGALLDGILLHQVLQWHHLISARRDDGTLEGLQANTLADGLFHATAYVLLLVGLAWSWRRPSGRSGRALLGGGLVGFGLWHVLDQLLSHTLLELHHIRPGEHQALYDWGVFAIGVAVGAVGWLLARDVPSRA